MAHFLRRRDRIAQPLRVEHYSFAVNRRSQMPFLCQRLKIL